MIIQNTNEEYHASEGISKSGLDQVDLSPFHYWSRYRDPNCPPEEPRTSDSGTWCARQKPSTLWPSTSLGPVQPLGLRNTIIGQRGRSVLPPSRASRWMRLISEMTWSKVAAIC